MELTNNKKLSNAIYLAAQNEWYGGAGEKRDFSITQLLSPPKVYWLMKRHEKEIIQDVCDRIWMLMGSAMHAILERANESDSEFQIMSRVRNFFEYIRQNPNDSDEVALKKFNEMVIEGIDPITGAVDNIARFFKTIRNDRYIIEKRYSYTTRNGLLITGGIDLFDKQEQVLHDYKFTSVWTWIYRNRESSRIEDYTEQLNMYRLFMEKMGIDVNGLALNLIFRDWSKSESKRDSKYPAPAEVIDIPLFGLDIVEKIVEEKVDYLLSFKNMKDDFIPVCTPKQRWEGQIIWAVKKKANKTACNGGLKYSKIDAETFLKEEARKLAKKELDNGGIESMILPKYMELLEIEIRLGTPTRCLDYCPANLYCNFYQEYIKNNPQQPQIYGE